MEALPSKVPTEHWSLLQHQLQAMSNPCGVCATRISSTLHAPCTEGDLLTNVKDQTLLIFKP